MNDRGEKQKRAVKPLIILLLFLIPAVMLYSRGVKPAEYISVTSQTMWDSDFMGQLDRYIAKNMPLHNTLAQWQLRLRLWGGQREQEGIFICGDTLLKHTDPPIDWYVRKNTQALQSFAQNMGVNTCLTLIPTASAIYQEKLPPYAFSQMYNQKQFIDEIYNQLSGQVTVVDTYTALFNQRNEYIYYRTENNLTALGGYYVYTAMGGKLGIENSSYSQFDIRYVGEGYKGDLYKTLPYKDVQPDTFPLFHYISGLREYTVTHKTTDGEKSYRSLYPLHVWELWNDTDVYLGGLSAVVDIRTSASGRIELPSLLVLGDKTALAYLPFLANHYQRITFLDLFQLTDAQYEEIMPDQYAQVLFAYGVETFMHTDIPLRAEHFVSLQ